MHEELSFPDKRVVGTKQLLRALEKGMIKTVYVAQDTDDFLYRHVMTAAQDKQVPVVKIESMKELARMCRVDVKATAAGLLR